MDWKPFPPLRRLVVDEVIIYKHRRHIVVRVTGCAAYLREYRPPKTVKNSLGEFVELEQEPTGDMEGVSPCAFLERTVGGEERF